MTQLINSLTALLVLSKEIFYGNTSYYDDKSIDQKVLKNILGLDEYYKIDGQKGR